MCWTGPVSIGMAAAGFAAAGTLAYKKWSKLLWIPVVYFALMELLQAFTYYTLGTCSPANQIFTMLSYIHIAFQPFFVNAFMLYFIPANFRNKIIGWVFTLCFASAIIMMIQLYPFEWAETCTPGTLMCGQSLCSVPGNFHLAWEIPFSEIGSMLGWIASWSYIFVAFLLPLIYGSWKTTGFHIIVGPVLAYSLTQNPNEWPAVWCLLSISYILIVFIPKVMNSLKVKKWYFWNYPSSKKK